VTEANVCEQISKDRGVFNFQDAAIHVATTVGACGKTGGLSENRHCLSRFFADGMTSVSTKRVVRSEIY